MASYGEIQGLGFKGYIGIYRDIWEIYREREIMMAIVGLQVAYSVL